MARRAPYFATCQKPQPADGNSRFHRNTFSQTYSPTQYELFNEFIEIDGQQLDCELWDTSGNIHKHQLGLLSYLSWDAVFLCYSVNSDKNYANCQLKVSRFGNSRAGRPDC